jgi:hypothetical protein
MGDTKQKENDDEDDLSVQGMIAEGETEEQVLEEEYYDTQEEETLDQEDKDAT